MKRYLALLFLIIAPYALNASTWTIGHLSSTTTQKDNTQNIEIRINNTIKVILEDAPLSGNLEVYSILGVKVKSINLKQCENGCYIDLPRGLYILKAGKVAHKVVVQ